MGFFFWMGSEVGVPACACAGVRVVGNGCLWED